MKLAFPDKAFIEIKKSSTPGSIVITVSAKDETNPLKKITNSVEITEKEFKFLISDIV